MLSLAVKVIMTPDEMDIHWMLWLHKWLILNSSKSNNSST